MSEQNSAASASVNRAKPYQLMLFPLNNGATNVYYVLVLSYIATFGSKVLALSMIFASVMVTGMRLFDAITDPIIGALMDRTNGKFGKFRPFMVIGNLIMAVSILVLYCLTPLIPASYSAREVQTFGTDTSRVPMLRAGQPFEVASSYVFLASDDASYMSGQVLHPNGGKIVGS